MKAGGAAVILAICLALPALANAPGQSLRPVPRPVEAMDSAAPLVVRVDASGLAPRESLRPLPRPGPAAPAQATGSEPEGPPRGLIELLAGGQTTGAGSPAVSVSLRPLPRPAGLPVMVRIAGAGGMPSRVAQPGRYGPLCGDRGIVGERVAPVRGRIGGCGISDPVRVREIDGIPLSQPATVNCEAALALRDWLDEAVVPTVGRYGGGVASLRVVASYSCRTRNNQPGARLSEHATGNAVDIAGIGLANGGEISVLEDWGRGREGRILRQLHEAACGTFGTVLGPESDRYHRDHFHFDVASYRSGAYCR